MREKLSRQVALPEHEPNLRVLKSPNRFLVRFFVHRVLCTTARVWNVVPQQVIGLDWTGSQFAMHFQRLHFRLQAIVVLVHAA